MLEISVAYAWPRTWRSGGMVLKVQRRPRKCRARPFNAFSEFLYIADSIVVTSLLLFDLLTPKKEKRPGHLQTGWQPGRSSCWIFSA